MNLEKETNENIKIKKENNDLIIKNNELKKEINVLMLKINGNKPNKPILIGLNNIGATCFMNSTLQCLSQTKELTNYFLDVKNNDRIIYNNIALENNNEL